MKLLILYRDKSEHATPIEMFMRDFTQRYNNIPIETRELDSREGWSTAKAYDITAYPAFLALDERGAVLQVWQGSVLPLMSDVASYAQ